MARFPKYKNAIKRNIVEFIPPSEQQQNELGDEMITWCLADTNILELDLFPLSKKYSPSAFYNIAKKNEYFAQALDIARAIVAIRIKTLWRTEKVDPKYAQAMLPVYDNQLKSWLLERATVSAQVKHQLEDASKTITVLLEKIPSPDTLGERES